MHATAAAVRATTAACLQLIVPHSSQKAENIRLQQRLAIMEGLEVPLAGLRLSSNYCVSIFTHSQSHTHTHTLSLLLVVTMKSKELKTKTSHAHSLILSHQTLS